MLAQVVASLKAQLAQIYHKLVESPKQVISLFFGLIVLCLGGGIYFFQANTAKTPPSATIDQTILTTETTAEEQSSAVERIYVDIKGSVKYPGVYSVAQSQRVQDLLTKAGGLTEDADTSQLNFAAKLVDQQLIYVPKIGETRSDQSQNQTPTVTESKININTADISELQELSGIGAKKAQDIINYREENGHFKSVEELQEISGIGEKTVEKLRNLVTITID
ncbi:ComEA family DNA-binding protein [Candidatus Enterococcus courvalinii]|uniref:ComEA family DNA-binding protein n=1 Tax=Candidatus Enterococcus courvalinii TaxID=2815329 RepID=A0ABS3I1K0_9ENTE|nr:ComEA family DNA-binding protein [Enterococcus sp. MSG2901]MBO0482585.1 ComEA family DNA-binding protein [Enterococcus sp. MSG2901]